MKMLFVTFASVAFVAAAPSNPEIEPSHALSNNTILAKRTKPRCGRSSYYSPSVGLGACGWQNADSEMVVALPQRWYSGKCGQMIQIGCPEKPTVMTKIVEMCSGCEDTQIDMSPGVFGKLADLAAGRVTTCWTYQ